MALRLGTRPATPAAEDRTLRRTQQRFLRRQRARRWLVWRRMLIALAAVVAVVGSVWLVFFSSVLSVQATSVVGVDVLSEREVRRAAEVPEDVPLATVDLAAIQARVEDLAPVASAEVSRSWPDTVTIEVTERSAVAAVLREGVWRGLDAEGVLYRTYPRRPEGLPEVRMRADTRVEALVEAASVVRSLPTDILRRVSYLDVRTIDAISFQLRNGALIRWGSADESGRKAQVLAVLLRQEASEYDVTAPGRPTIRP